MPLREMVYFLNVSFSLLITLPANVHITAGLLLYEQPNIECRKVYEM